VCKWGDCVDVRVRIAADMSCTGRAKWKKAKIDHCIAPLIKALQDGGVNMLGSCCGHGKREGYIHLDDGRSLLILDKGQTIKYMGYPDGLPPGIDNWLEETK